MQKIDMKDKKNKLWKYNGIFLIATGIIHSVVGIAVGKDILWAILKDGLLNAIGMDDMRQIMFWFMLVGVLIIILGHILHYYIKKEQKPAPKLLGYYLLIMSIIGCIAIPTSGFWLFIPQALIILFAKRDSADIKQN